jgi:hypothetical protein
MKKAICILLAITVSLPLLSWGPQGHRVVALIAQKHLTAHSREVLNSYLAGSSVEEASTWADEHRTAEDAGWHFINLPLGLSYEKFTQQVKESKGTIYTALLQMLATLQNPSASAAEKTKALRFLIHLVGDAHQPMHVSRAEDKGGNTIQVRFDTAGTNLHALWDTRMIAHEGLTEAQCVAQYDAATPQEAEKWQKEDIIQWLWESYQLSTELYKQTKPGQTVSEGYYKKYIPVIHKRVNQAGIRLAGMLNALFASVVLPEEVKSATFSMGVVDREYVPSNWVKPEQLAGMAGKRVTVRGKICGFRLAGMDLEMYMDAPEPKQLYKVLLRGDAQRGHSGHNGKMATATGKVTLNGNSPEIVVSDPEYFEVTE